MAYFEQFPYINYQFPDNVYRQLKNISIKPAIIESVKNERANFITHTIRDGDTVELIANEYYGDVNLHWAVMLANDMISPYLDMPLSGFALEEKLYQKYKVQKDSDSNPVTLTRQETMNFIDFVGTSSNNYTTVIGDKATARPHHFVDSNKNEYTYDFIVNNSSRKDAFGRSITAPTASPVSIRSYEEDLNESKRTILILKQTVVTQLYDELRKILNE